MRDNVGDLSDARRILGEGHVAHVMAAVVDAPARADPLVRMLQRRKKPRRRSHLFACKAWSHGRSDRPCAPAVAWS